MITADFSKAPAIGAAVPDFTLPATDGREVTLSALPGPVLVFFTCNHCPYVVGWEGRVQQLALSYAGQVHFVGINANDASRYLDDSFARMKERAQKGLPYLYLHDADQDVSRAWGAQVTPEFYLLDGDHHLAYHGRVDASHQNPAAAGDPTLHQALAAVVAGQIPRPRETEVQGCSIKWKL